MYEASPILVAPGGSFHYDAECLTASPPFHV
jgi:hypothetical protein